MISKLPSSCRDARAEQPAHAPAESTAGRSRIAGAVIGDREAHLETVAGSAVPVDPTLDRSELEGVGTDVVTDVATLRHEHIGVGTGLRGDRAADPGAPVVLSAPSLLHLDHVAAGLESDDLVGAGGRIDVHGAPVLTVDVRELQAHAVALLEALHDPVDARARIEREVDLLARR